MAGHHLLNAALPSEIMERIQVDRQAVRLAGEIGKRLCSGASPELTKEQKLRFFYRALPTLQDRLQFLWSFAVEPRRVDWEFFLLPPSLKGLYAIIRPCRMIGLALKRVTIIKKASEKNEPEYAHKQGVLVVVVLTLQGVIIFSVQAGIESPSIKRLIQIFSLDEPDVKSVLQTIQSYSSKT